MLVRHLSRHVIALLVGVVLVPAPTRAQDAAVAPPSAVAAPAPPAQIEREPERTTWGALDATGSGFLLGRTEFGEMSLSGYAVIRYINQGEEEELRAPVRRG